MDADHQANLSQDLPDIWAQIDLSLLECARPFDLIRLPRELIRLEKRVRSKVLAKVRGDLGMAGTRVPPHFPRFAAIAAAAVLVVLAGLFASGLSDYLTHRPLPTTTAAQTTQACTTTLKPTEATETTCGTTASSQEAWPIRLADRLGIDSSEVRRVQVIRRGQDGVEINRVLVTDLEQVGAWMAIVSEIRVDVTECAQVDGNIYEVAFCLSADPAAFTPDAVISLQCFEDKVNFTCGGDFAEDLDIPAEGLLMNVNGLITWADVAGWLDVALSG